MERDPVHHDPQVVVQQADASGEACRLGQWLVVAPRGVGALDNLPFSDDELAAIDKHAVEGGVNLWSGSSNS